MTHGCSSVLWLTKHPVGRSLEIFAGLMNTSASKLNLRLGKAADSGETINVWRYLGDMTMDVVGAAAFG